MGMGWLNRGWWQEDRVTKVKENIKVESDMRKREENLKR